MAILKITTDFVGQVDVKPRLVRIETNDTFAEVTTADYLKNSTTIGFTFNKDDQALVTYGSAKDQSQMFKVSISGTTITLIPQGDGVILPVVDGNFANFSGTDGTLDDKGYSPSDATKTKVVMADAAVITNRMATYTDVNGTLSDDAATATNGGNIAAGLSGTAGEFISFPTTAAKGSFKFVGADNVGDTVNSLTHESCGQATVYTLPDPGQATASPLVAALSISDVNANIIHFSVTCGQAALATAGTVILIDSSGSKQYKVLELFINSGGTNFSGGGGDRLGEVSDGTTSYSIVPAASLQTLANGRWGDTAMAFPASAAIDTATAAGQDLVFQYNGGATDYTAGSVVISGTVVRIA